MITDDGKIDFSDITLISKSGEYLFQDRYQYGRTYAVSHDTFRNLLVVTAHLEAQYRFYDDDEYRDEFNTLDFLLSQLEITDELFQATLMENSSWILSKEKI